MARTAAIPRELKQKMAQSVSGTGPSLVPPGVGSQLPVDTPIKEEVPFFEDMIADSDDKEQLEKLVSAHVALNAQVKALETQLDGVKTRIKHIVGQYGIEKARSTSGALINYYSTTRTTLSRIKLVAAGVDEEVLDSCTDITHSMALKITKY